MAERSGSLTNKDLNTLLTRLGFESGEETQKFRRVWRHPGAGTTILLPSNKTLEPPLQVDLVSVRTHLDYNGHFSTRDFDEFVKTTSIPVRS